MCGQLSATLQLLFTDNILSTSTSPHLSQGDLTQSIPACHESVTAVTQQSSCLTSHDMLSIWLVIGSPVGVANAWTPSDGQCQSNSRSTPPFNTVVLCHHECRSCPFYPQSTQDLQVQVS